MAVVSNPPARGSSLGPTIGRRSASRSPPPCSRVQREEHDGRHDDGNGDDGERQRRANAVSPPKRRPAPVIPAKKVGADGELVVPPPALWLIPPSPGLLTFARDTSDDEVEDDQSQTARIVASSTSTTGFPSPALSSPALSSPTSPLTRASAESERSVAPSLSQSVSSRESSPRCSSEEGRGGTLSGFGLGLGKLGMASTGSLTDVVPRKSFDSAQTTPVPRHIRPSAYERSQQPRALSIVEDPHGLGAAPREAYPFAVVAHPTASSVDTLSPTVASRSSSREASPDSSRTRSRSATPIYDARRRAGVVDFSAADSVRSGGTTDDERGDDDDDEEEMTLTSSFHVYERGTGSAITVADLSLLPGYLASSSSSSADAALAKNDSQSGVKGNGEEGSDVDFVPAFPRGRDWREREDSCVYARVWVDKGRSRDVTGWAEVKPEDVGPMLREMKACGWKAMGWLPKKGW